jgi:hypothetical protein
VQEVLEAINDAAVTPEEFQEMLVREPKAVVFRNEMRMVVSRMLAVNSAAAQRKRLVVWHSEDTFQGPAQHRGQSKTASGTAKGCEHGPCQEDRGPQCLELFL